MNYRAVTLCRLSEHEQTVEDCLAHTKRSTPPLIHPHFTVGGARTTCCMRITFGGIVATT